MNTMTAAVYTGVGVKLHKVSVPVLLKDFCAPKKYATNELFIVGKENLVLLEVEAASICGTDLEIVKNPPGHDATVDVTLGHEYIGRVIEVGKSVSNVAPGDRVGVDPNIKCGMCWFCKNDMASQCRDMTTLGIFVNGGFAKYNVAPAKQLYKIPADMELDRAIFFEPLTCATHAWDKIGGIEIGGSVLIFGAGPIGCYFTELARLAGAGTIIVVEPSDFRRDFVRKLGAHFSVDPRCEDTEEIVRDATRIDKNTFGVDLAIDACGRPEVVKTAMDLVRPGGVISTFGEQDVHATADKVSFTKVTQKELTIIGSYVTTKSFNQTISVLKSPDLRLPKLITHRIPLDKIDDAYTIMKEGTGVEIMIYPGDAK